jgi:hypothetical protein
VARHGSPDLGQSHFERGQSLRGGFVKFAAHAALFLAANREQLVGKPAQIGLGACVGSDVTRNSDYAHNFSRGIGDGRGEAVENTDGTIRQRVRFGKPERQAIANCRFEIPSKFLHILEVQSFPEFFEAERSFGRGQAVQPEELFRPPDGAALQVKFPGAHFGHFFGVFQHQFGLAQALFDVVLRGQVLSPENHPCRFGRRAARRATRRTTRRTGRGTLQALEADGEPTWCLINNGGELKGLPAVNRRNPRKNSAHEPSVIAAHDALQGLAEKGAANFLGHGAVGTPDALQFMLLIEFENEFREFADQGCEVVEIPSRDWKKLLARGGLQGTIEQNRGGGPRLGGSGIVKLTPG